MRKVLILIAIGMLFHISASASSECETMAKSDNREVAEKSIQVCSNNINISPDNDSLFWRAYAFHRLGKFDAALKDINSFIAKHPKDAQALSNRAAIYREKKQYSLALADVEQAIILSPSDSDYFALKGRILFEINKYNDAYTYFEKALLLNPNSERASFGCIFTLFFLDRPSEAVALWERYESKSDSAANSRMHIYISKELHSRGLKNKAFFFINSYIDKNPSDTNAVKERARMNIDDGINDAAIGDLLIITNDKPKDAEAHALLALAYFNIGEFRKSILSNIDAIKINPTYTLALNNLGRSLFAMGDNENALTYYKYAVSTNPSDPQLYFNVAWTLDRMGKTNEAFQWYKDCLLRAKDQL